MDMKRILQALDGASTKPVEGASDMSRFLRVVSEADLNQSASKAASITQAPDGTYTVTYLRAPLSTTGTPDEGKIPAPQTGIRDLASAQRVVASIDKEEQVANSLSSPIQVQENTQVPAMPDVSGMQPNTSKDLGNGEKVTLNQDGTISYSGAWGTYVYNAQGQHVKTQSPSFAGYQQTTNAQGQVTDKSYNAGPLSIQQGQQGTSATYDLGVATVGTQTNAQGQTTNTVQENSIAKFLSIIDKNDVEILKEEQNNNATLNEGANPHKVSLPVQMAMNHYQQDSKPVVKKESLLKKYFAEAEEAIIEKKTEKSQLIKQYSQSIANKLLVKESKKKIKEQQQPSAHRDERVIKKELDAAQGQLSKVEHALNQARQVTKEIKYDDTASGIILRLRELAKTVPNLDDASLRMAERDVEEAARALESAVYGLEEAFSDAVSSVTNQIDSLEGELQEIDWQRKYGRDE